MKGVRLHVRRATPEDGEAVSRFFDGEHHRCTAGEGFVGKILGEIVAHAATRSGGHAVQIDCIWVASHLRRKRIGRIFLREISSLVAPSPLVARIDCPLREFLVSEGFEEKDGLLQSTSN